MITIKEYLTKVDDVIANGKFKDTWESLSAFKMPEWYKKGRFGLFIHWGVYSVPAVESEWFPRLTYIKGTKSYDYRVKKYGKDFDYRQFIDLFNPTLFNADEWVSTFKDSGARYIMPVCEHHDGIKMYKSELNKWNMMDLPQHRDYIAELKLACEKQDVGLLNSSHRAEHYWFLNGGRNFPNSEIAKNEYPDFYGPAVLHTNGEANGDDNKIVATQEWLEDWLASSCEMVDRNQPLAMYFDWWIYKAEFKPYLKKFLAYYYNRGLEWGKEVCVFYKFGAIMNGCAVYDVERGQIDKVNPVLWQNDTAIAKNSWGYTEGNQFKTSCDILLNLIDVISKNGCYMLNVGPKADGSICVEEKKVLAEIGKWLRINGEAIYDSQPFEVGYGEGKAKKAGAFKENLKYGKNDYRFTYKTNAIYIFPMSVDPRNTFKIKNLKFANENGIRYNIKNIEVLGYENKVSYNQDKTVMTINIDGIIQSEFPLCIKLTID